MKYENTQALRLAYLRYLKSTKYDIYDAYGRPSRYKVEAWNGYCHELMREHDGHGLKVIGAGSSEFSAGFLFINEDGDEVFCYITKTYDKYMIVRSKERV